MDFELRPLDAVGAEIVGLDLSRPIRESTRQDLYNAWLEAGILLFRGIATSSERHVALSRCFGELEIHPVESIRLEGHPEIISLKSTGDTEPIIHYFDDVPIAGMIPWHTDLIYTPTPSRGALLRMVVKPREGGDDWDVGDVVLWDNWRTLHCAFGTPPECEREVQRTTLKGDQATGRLL